MSDDPYWNPAPGDEPSGRFNSGDPLVTDSFEGWWNASLAVVERSWRSIGLILLLGVVLPRWIFGSFRSLADGDRVEVDDLAGTWWPGAGAAVAGGLLGLVLLYVAGSAVLAATRAAAAEAAGGFLALGEAFSYGFRRGLKFWLWLMLAWITVAVGMVLCVLPGLWAAFALSLMAAAAVFEPHRSPYARSIQLTHSAFWAALGRLIIVVLIAFAANLIIGVIGVLLAGVWHGVFAGWLASVLTVLTEAVMALLLLVPMIWVLGAALCTYAWLRGRAEAVSATSLSADAAAGAPPKLLAEAGSATGFMTRSGTLVARVLYLILALSVCEC